MTAKDRKMIREALLKARRGTPLVVRGFWLVRIPASVGREIVRRARSQS